MSNPNPKNQFVKGDKRINRKGRPKTFDALRALAQQLAHETIVVKDGDEKVEVTIAEAILRGWSRDKKHQKDFIEYAFGKVPDKTEHTGKDGAATIKITLKQDDDN